MRNSQGNASRNTREHAIDAFDDPIEMTLETYVDEIDDLLLIQMSSGWTLDEHQRFRELERLEIEAMERRLESNELGASDRAKLKAEIDLALNEGIGILFGR